MSVARLDHVNIRTAKLARMSAFYQEILGLEDGWRPGFSFPGAWLYCGKDPVVHLVETDRAQRAEEPAIEHFAFTGEGSRAAFEEKLTAANIAFWNAYPPGYDMVQVNFEDPDGNHLHVDFADD